jgi:hypothetical protein
MFKMVKGMKPHFNDYRSQAKLLELKNVGHKISKYLRKKGVGENVLLLLHYNLSSLALPPFMTDVHSVLSKVLCLHISTPKFVKSNLTSSFHPNLGLYFLLSPPGLLSSNFFTVLSPAIHKTCPSHSILCASITFKISDIETYYIFP